MSSTAPITPDPGVQEFADQIAEESEHAVAFFRPDGREVLVEVWKDGHKYIYRYEAGMEPGICAGIKFHDWELMQ